MGIGTGWTMHELRASAYVVDISHNIAAPLPLGQFSWTSPMWVDATEAAEIRPGAGQRGS